MSPRAFCCCLLTALFVVAGIHATAQPCEPIAANRNKLLVFAGGQRVLRTSFFTYDGRYHIISDSERDTVQVRVYKDSELVQQFGQLRGAVVQPYMVYEEHGEVRIDSLDPGRPGRSRHYEPIYAYSGHIYATLEPSQGKLTYYAATGKDSIHTWRYPDGRRRKQIVCDSQGVDAVTTEWSNEGIIISRRAGRTYTTYHPDGALHTCEHDTIIARPVRCLREWSPAGILRSVQYRADDTPVHIWSYYREDGTLLRTRRYRRPGSVIMYEYVPEPTPPEQVYQFVEQQAEPPWNAANYIRDGLARALCESRAPLNGRYAMTITVSKDGTTAYQSVSGQNSNALEPGLRALFEHMPVWKPHKEMGMATDVRMVLYLEVQRK